MSADHSTHRDGAVVVATKRKLEDFAREVNALAEKHDIPFPEQMSQNMKKALLPPRRFYDRFHAHRDTVYQKEQ
jgi:hypothetical protein